MKSLRFFALAFFVALASCDVDNTDEIPVGNSEVDENNVLRADIGTFAFESTSPNTRAIQVSDSQLEVSGGEGNARIVLTFDGFTGNGLYTLEGETQILTARYVVTAPDTPGAPDRIWNAVSDPSSIGQATISTANDTFVEGTYSFTAVSESGEADLILTNGTFKVQLQ